MNETTTTPETKPAAAGAPKRTPRKTLDHIADDWIGSHFPDATDRDIYRNCFMAGYRAARPYTKKAKPPAEGKSE